MYVEENLRMAVASSMLSHGIVMENRGVLTSGAHMEEIGMLLLTGVSERPWPGMAASEVLICWICA